jgi:hypothetical protein
MVTIVNGVIELIAKLGEAIIWLLPKSPFSAIQNLFDGEWLGYVNYYIPIAEMVNFASAWLLAIGLWYLYAIILRWVKAIR